MLLEWQQFGESIALEKIISTKKGQEISDAMSDRDMIVKVPYDVTSNDVVAPVAPRSNETGQENGSFEFKYQVSINSAAILMLFAYIIICNIYHRCKLRQAKKKKKNDQDSQ